MEGIHEATVLVRLYVMKGINLTPADPEGSSDAYLKVKMGNKEYDDRDNYVEDSNSPGFWKHFDFTTKLPGPSILTIQIWDYDGLGDDLIGETLLDVERRWFSKEWQKLSKGTDVKLPIEERCLWIGTSTVSQGKL